MTKYMIYTEKNNLIKKAAYMKKQMLEVKRAAETEQIELMPNTVQARGAGYSIGRLRWGRGPRFAPSSPLTLLESACAPCVP